MHCLIRLGAHNFVRCRHGYEPLSWQATTAAHAEAWADTCTYQHSVQSDFENGGAGENVRPVANILIIIRDASADDDIVHVSCIRGPRSPRQSKRHMPGTTKLTQPMEIKATWLARHQMTPDMAKAAGQTRSTRLCARMDNYLDTLSVLNGHPKPQVGHYTALIWSDTSHLGCGTCPYRGPTQSDVQPDRSEWQIDVCQYADGKQILMMRLRNTTR